MIYITTEKNTGWIKNYYEYTEKDVYLIIDNYGNTDNNSKLSNYSNKIKQYTNLLNKAKKLLIQILNNIYKFNKYNYFIFLI